ncbi:hypothetical protein L505_4758 [Bordetella bronchiseptica F4563]|nr:hypothetical protein L507_4552 [Bordetella bronchiseptica CA90 BB02]KCV25542.1 hypothetical protein L489_5060 [Bordetella bronchiseptica 00-P-2730]KDC26488.1 hypothetical protein L505_4758 [Bordetella bronchiseptica F4563]
MPTPPWKSCTCTHEGLLACCWTMSRRPRPWHVAHDARRLTLPDTALRTCRHSRIGPHNATKCNASVSTGNPRNAGGARKPAARANGNAAHARGVGNRAGDAR